MIKKLIDIISKEDIRICLNEMLACYAKAGTDITIFGLEETKVFLAASTISSDELKGFLMQEIEDSILYYNNINFCKIRKNREGIEKSEVCLLKQDDKVIGYMVIEKEIDERLQINSDLLKLFSIALRLYSNYRQSSYYGKMDIKTGVYGRDIFLEKLKTLDLSRTSQLAIVGFPELIQRLHILGLEKADSIVKYAGTILKKYFGKGATVYRYGEGSLAVLSGEDQDKFFIELENMFVQLEEQYPEEEISIVITSIRENPFQSLFLCDNEYRKNRGISIVRSENR